MAIQPSAAVYGDELAGGTANKSKVVQAVENGQNAGISTDDQFSQHPSDGEPSSVSGDQISGGQTFGNQGSGNQEAGNPAPGEPTTGRQNTDGQSSGDKASGNQASANQTSGDSLSEEQLSKDQSDGSLENEDDPDGAEGNSSDVKQNRIEVGSDQKQTEEQGDADPDEEDTQEEELQAGSASQAVLTVTDTNGYTVSSWQSGGSDIFFLTRAVDLSSLTIHSSEAIKSTDRTSEASGDEDGTSEATGDGDSSPASPVYDLTEDFSQDADLVLYYGDDGSRTIKVMQSDLPSLTLTIGGGVPLSSVHANKDASFGGGSLNVSGSGKSDKFYKDVTIKGRGNSSWAFYDKKGYQIKFGKKQALLGMDKAKKWVLLPNNSDPSMIRNEAAFRFGRELKMKYVPDSRYVDLWVNGDYRGTYLVTEKVEIGFGRLDLGGKGVLFEYDQAFYSGEPYVVFDDYHFAYVLKDPDPNEANSDTLTSFKARILAAERNDKDPQMVLSNLDPTSFGQMYLVNEYLLNKEYTATSNFLYQNDIGSPICAGPLWDFDTCMTAGSDSADGNFIYQQVLFSILICQPAFIDQVQDLLNQSDSFLRNYSGLVSEIEGEIASSADMNFTRWPSLLGGTDVKGVSRYATWRENVDAQKRWLDQRYRKFSLNRAISTESDTVTMYRLYNPNSGEHLYTADTNERNTLSAIGWNYEGVGWIAPSRSSTPVYRLYNPNTGDHHYTIGKTERDYLVSIGWKYEGIGWYSDDAKGMPLYRQFNPNEKIGTHNYTTSQVENDYLVSIGWNYEGIGWYGIRQ